MTAAPMVKASSASSRPTLKRIGWRGRRCRCDHRRRYQLPGPPERDRRNRNRSWSTAAASTPKAARLIQQRADVGLEEVPFMGADGIFGPEADRTGRRSFRRRLRLHTTRPVSSDSRVRAHRAIPGSLRTEEPAASFHTNAFDAYTILVMGIESVGTLDDEGNLVVNRAALLDYVRTLSWLRGRHRLHRLRRHR